MCWFLSCCVEIYCGACEGQRAERDRLCNAKSRRRRAAPEAVELNFGHIQQREEHWAIVDLKGKAGHIRTIPMPAWVKNVLDQSIWSFLRATSEGNRKTSWMRGAIHRCCAKQELC